MVLDDSYNSLTGFIPADAMQAKGFNCDPLPPLTRVSVYDDDFFQGVEDLFGARAQTRPNQRWIEQLMPEPMFLQMMQVRARRLAVYGY
jgi:hypothetical protein